MSEDTLRKTPCCGYEWSLGGDDPKGPIFWNPFNNAVQCHTCGESFAAYKQAQADAPALATMREALRDLIREVCCITGHAEDGSDSDPTCDICVAIARANDALAGAVAAPREPSGATMSSQEAPDALSLAERLGDELDALAIAIQCEDPHRELTIRIRDAQALLRQMAAPGWRPPPCDPFNPPYVPTVTTPGSAAPSAPTGETE